MNVDALVANIDSLNLNDELSANDLEFGRANNLLNSDEASLVSENDVLIVNEDGQLAMMQV